MTPTQTEQTELQLIQSLINRIILIGDEFERLVTHLKGPKSASWSLSLWQDTWSKLHVQFTSAQHMHADLRALVSQAQHESLEYFSKDQWKGIVFNFEQVDDLITVKVNEIYKAREATQERDSSFQTSSPNHRSYQLNESTSAVQLPRLELTPFDGTYDNWPTVFSLLSILE